MMPLDTSERRLCLNQLSILVSFTSNLAASSIISCLEGYLFWKKNNKLYKIILLSHKIVSIEVGIVDWFGKNLVLLAFFSNFLILCLCFQFVLFYFEY